VIIRLKDIKDDGLSLAFGEEIETFPALVEMSQAGECEFLAPVQTRLRVFQVQEMVEVEGESETRGKLSCSRCLNDFETPIRAQYALTFVRDLPPVDDDAEGAEIEISAEEMGLIPFSGEEIDLKEAIQEQVIMAMPIRAVCDESCRGLCPRCGADLNEAQCGCEEQTPEVDRRFAALKNFKVNK
jgi:uncharacterized protein